MKKFFSLQRFAKKIKLTKKDDVYSNYLGDHMIYALAGNDSISNMANHVTVIGGIGKDTISNNGGYVSLSGGAGNDSILNDYYLGNNVTIDGGEGNDTIKSYNDYVTINGGTGDDYLEASSGIAIFLEHLYTGSYVTLKGGKGNDTIFNSGPHLNLLLGGAGNDSILNDYYLGNNVTIDGGAGNDTIFSHRDNVTISGGAGNDFIETSGRDVTINGGKGKDLISLGSYAENTLIEYASGDGNDTIFGFDSDDTLQITKGSYSAKASENDVIVTVGKGAVTLKGMAGKSLSITNSKGKTITKTYGSSALFAENNFSENELESIIESKSPVVLEEFKISYSMNLAAKTSLTSGIDYDKN